MDEIINRLTDNYQYGTDIILLLTLDNDVTSIHYLNYLNIIGKRLDNLKNSLKEFDLQYLKQTIRFLRSGFPDIKDIYDNLDRDEPIYFIPRLLKVGEDWEMAYENFTSEFNRKFTSNKSR